MSGSGESESGGTAKRTRWFWIDRDDGEMIEGPFDSAEGARARLHVMYDEAEYVVARTDYDRRGVACNECGGVGWIEDDPADSGGHPCPYCSQSFRNPK